MYDLSTFPNFPHLFIWSLPTVNSLHKVIDSVSSFGNKKWPFKVKNHEVILNQIHPPVRYNKDSIFCDKWGDGYSYIL